MKKKVKLLALFFSVVLVLFCGIGIFKNHQEKEEKYSYTVSQVNACLERIVSYSKRCLENLPADNPNDSGQITDAFSTLFLTLNDSEGLYNRNSREISSSVEEFMDYFNGEYPRMSAADKTVCLQSLIQASEKLLSSLETDSSEIPVDTLIQEAAAFAASLDQIRSKTI